MRSILFLLLFCSVFSPAQQHIPVVRATHFSAKIRVHKSDHITDWTITPSARPDIWNVTVPRGGTLRCTLVTDVDSISVTVAEGTSADFVVLLNGTDSAYTRINGLKEPVYFSPQYQQQFRATTNIEVPEVSELVNIIIAMTDKGTHDSDLVEHSSDYYRDVVKQFGPFSADPLVVRIDSLLTKEWWKYFYVRMDAYAFQFIGETIRQSETYDRLNFDGIPNTLLPFIAQLERFAAQTGFREFYRRHIPFFAGQISYFREKIGVRTMQQWLKKNFPSVSYDCYKVIFSPLAGGSQSARHFSNNNFNEALVYINFPYGDSTDERFSSTVNDLRKGNVLFTELNHSYINPETQKYLHTESFRSAFASLSFWETAGSSAHIGYPNAAACFNEYMNWALVSLYYIDHCPAADQAMMIHRVEKMMVDIRGFSKFREFNRELMRLYTVRSAHHTAADLYPAIVAWCEQQVLEAP